MNTKLFFALWAVFCVSPEVLVQSESSPNSDVWAYSSYPPDGAEYVSTITSKIRDSSPDWADTSPNPPISARKAMKLAKATLDATLKEKIDPILARNLVGVTLVPLDEKKWCWEVSYEWHRRVGGESGIPCDFRVFVLMNGTVVQPVKHDREPLIRGQSEDKGGQGMQTDRKNGTGKQKEPRFRVPRTKTRTNRRNDLWQPSPGHNRRIDTTRRKRVRSGPISRVLSPRRLMRGRWPFL